MTTIAQFADLLKERMGLSAHSVGLPVIEAAVKARLAACGVSALQQYWELVNASADELQELIDAVIIPETWFFRDAEAFGALVEEASKRWFRADAREPLRLLSMPCASGEEPYSIAMALLQAGFAPDAFRVDGIDISVRVLERARRAIYGRNSFRGKNLEYRERFFERTDNEFRLTDAVRAQVDFQQGNLLEPGFMAGAVPYDVVFCRNLLIYFDSDAQSHAVRVLKRLLKPDAMLFVGPAESGLLLNHDFISARVPLAFAFRKKPEGAPQAISTVVHLRKRKPSPGARTAAPPARPVGKPMRAARPAPKVVPAGAPPEAALDAIAELANRGLLEEAIGRAEACLRAQGPSAQLYHLMALAHDASGRNDEAERYYRKALYLDPAHHEALVHLAYLVGRRGDAAGAERLHVRARRASGRRGH